MDFQEISANHMLPNAEEGGVGEEILIEVVRRSSLTVNGASSNESFLRPKEPSGCWNGSQFVNYLDKPRKRC